MPVASDSTGLPHADGAPSRALAELLEQARALQQAALAGHARRPLLGKNIALLCEREDDPDARQFRSAAAELGAQVSHIRLGLSELRTPQELRHAARVLGRLYDALACEGMASELVRQVGDAAGVPVFDGIATAGLTTAQLGGLLGGAGSAEDHRRFVLQAALLRAIA